MIDIFAYKDVSQQGIGDMIDRDLRIRLDSEPDPASKRNLRYISDF